MSIGSSEETPEESGTRLRLPDRATTSDGAPAVAPEAAVARKNVFHATDVSVNYGAKRALEGVSMEIGEHQATAFIGPSGCGKSTFLRCLNRMNDSITGFSIGGELTYHGHDLYGPEANRVEVRRRIGMVFQKPNPFPKSIYDNIAWAAKNLGMKDDLDGRVERALRSAALWDEVKDRLKASALGLSGGQQQRLCIARAIAIEPDVVLLDEPASALDPIATAAIEDLIHALKSEYTIVIVTHNMQQAMRVADKTAFFSLEETRFGTLIDYDQTDKLFSRPADKRTEAYITGQFG
jgi:phosphate transport system ATP-binding protein